MFGFEAGTISHIAISYEPLPIIDTRRLQHATSAREHVVSTMYRVQIWAWHVSVKLCGFIRTHQRDVDTQKSVAYKRHVLCKVISSSCFCVELSLLFHCGSMATPLNSDTRTGDAPQVLSCTEILALSRRIGFSGWRA